MNISAADIERFSKYTERQPNGCLLWTGGKHTKGYGMFHMRVDGKDVSITAHLFSWLAAGKVLHAGCQLMHQCPGGDNPACCEVLHLEPGTPAQHAIDRAIKGQIRRSAKGLPYGVAPCHKGGKFGSQVKLDGKMRHFGSYPTADEASAVSMFIRSIKLALPKHYSNRSSVMAMITSRLPPIRNRTA